MKKSLIIIGVLVVLLIGLIGLNFVLKKDDDTYVDDYLIDDGYVYDEELGYYKKQVSDLSLGEYLKRVSEKKNSEFEELYFYSGSYKLIKLKMNYKDDVSTTYSSTHNYMDDKIVYKYEVTIYSSTIIVGGEYKKNEDQDDKFSCEVVTTVAMDDWDKDIYCNRAKYETLLFIEDSNNLVRDSRFAKIIEKGYQEK